MDGLIAVLYGIPVVGLVFQFLGYLIEVIPIISPFILQVATPIALAALCAVLCERSGVVNIGIEGIMITAAFVGWYAGVVLGPILGSSPSIVFGITPTLAVALLAAILSGVLISALHAWLSISVRADQIISGTIINIAAFGLTGYLNSLISRTSPVSPGSLSRFRLPDELADIPVIGWILNMLLSQGPIAMSVIVIVIVFQVLLFRSRWGLRTRAVGEHPKAADTVGIDVFRLRYVNVIFAGALAALGGAYLSMEGTSSFQEGMTTGRGFIGLAAMIIGRWTPLGAFGAALLFASTTAVGQSMKILPPSGDLGTILGGIPGQLFDAIPYLVTIIVLAGVVGRTVPPAADGQPYQREAAT
jgi:general nucleoside transport system permease protein